MASGTYLGRRKELRPRFLAWDRSSRVTRRDLNRYDTFADSEDGRASTGLPGSHVAEANALVQPGSAILVYVSEEMEPRFDVMDGVQEIATAHASRLVCSVTETPGRAVSDQDIRIWGNLRPLRGESGPSRQKEHARIILRLPRAAPEKKPLKRDALVLKIEDFLPKESNCFVVRVDKTAIVVPCHEHLVGMGLRTKPLGKYAELGKIPIPPGIPRVNQNIALGQTPKLLMVPVRIRNRNNSHNSLLLKVHRSPSGTYALTPSSAVGPW